MSRPRKRTRSDGAADGAQNPFGMPNGSVPQRTLTIADAVRRCRWIAVDLNATGFGLFFADLTPEGDALVPCFDGAYPAIEPETRTIARDDHASEVRHVRTSSVPVWWNDTPPSLASEAFEKLDWAQRIGPLVPGTCGIAFPVQTERGQCGLIAFRGTAITLDPQSLYDIHARCYSLFESVARIRPSDTGRMPSISKRELECLKLTANGYTSEEIAHVLKLSVHTANQYLASSTQKLNAVNRMHAVAKALRLGLIE